MRLSEGKPPSSCRRHTLTLRRWLFACVLTSGLVPGVALAQVADWPSERPPRPLPARDVKFPPYAMRTLANGLQVVAVSHHEQPAISVRLLVRAGGAQDPPQRPGVAAVAAALLDQGTATRSAAQIAHTIDSIGGVIGAGAATEFTSLTAIVLKDSLNVALELVSDLARNPAFAPQELELQRKQMLSGLTVSYDDPDYLAGVVFDRLVYGFHPYGRPDGGTPESLGAITRDDLMAFHKAWFGANNAILAIVGDVTSDEAFAGAEKAFGSWGKSASTAEKPAEAPTPTRRLVIIDRPGAVQTEIRAGHAALPRKHPDYLALDLAMKILGGEGGNRLHRVLRSERGLTYGASADLNALRDSGTIVADTDTRSDTTGEALRLMVDEMWKLQRQRVSERELGDAQAYLTGSFPLTIETPSAIAMQVLNAVFYGLDMQELQTFRERVNAVTVDDIQRVARTYLHPDRLSIVLVGDASKFQSQLAGVGFDQVERIPVAELDLNTSDLRRKRAGNAPAEFDRAIHTRVASTVVGAGHGRFSVGRGLQPPPNEARELIDRAVRAKGGLELLRSIRTVHAESELITETGTGRVTVPTTIRVRYPGQYRIDSRMPTGPLVQVFDRGTSWLQDAQGAKDLSPEAAESMRQNVVRDQIPLLIALSDRRLSARRIPDVAIEGVKMPALAVDLRLAGPLTLILDPDRALIVSQRYRARGPSGVIEERLADYRPVNGLNVAFSVTIRHPGEPPITRVLRSFEYNAPLDAALFTRPG
jgi:zinc protease